ncbi:ABC transporter ATP-binding protein [uncultured Bilophila sp.]|uniref:ABC transporter ATP-binding protein n=1 Tax=uncultured Bilophila sp. TaxID=529385 RepID=UPI00280C03C8|nr:ABC transporter ATP-binding protein [uncultured Bilophila sp.]
MSLSASTPSPIPATSAPLLQAEGVTVRFDACERPFDVVRDVSFTLHPGRTLCLVGESGCGKSMTALSLLRLIPEPGRLAAGRILFEGRDLAGLPESEMERVRGRDIGMIFQEPMTSLNPVIRVGEQVAEPLMRHLRLSKKAALAEAVELFRLVGIPAPDMRIRDYPHQLSGGMRQRVMIATALACKPRLLLADEPTTALDVTIQGQILALLGDLSRERGMGLLLITHDLGVVAEMADEVGVMYAGRIVERAPVRALFAEPLHPYTRGLIRSAPTLDTPPSAKLDAIPGTVPSPGALPQGCPFRPRCPEAHGRCFKTPPTVESAGSDGVREVCCWLAEAR